MILSNWPFRNVNSIWDIWLSNLSDWNCNNWHEFAICIIWMPQDFYWWRKVNIGSNNSSVPSGILKATVKLISFISPLYTGMRPEKLSGRSVVAQTQKVLFLCNCCSTNLVHFNRTTKTAVVVVVTQQVAQNRQSEGRTVAMVAQGLPWSPPEWRHSGCQCSLNGQWCYKWGRRIAQNDAQCLQ